jgi:hypothetical protein
MRGECDCEHVHGVVQEADATDIGVDLRNGRYGQVTLHRCAACRAQWLHYLVDYEAFSRSGRWFCGRVDEPMAGSVAASNAIAVLAELPWYWVGGSYFDDEVAKRSGPVPVDLYGPPALE